MRERRASVPGRLARTMMAGLLGYAAVVLAWGAQPVSPQPASQGPASQGPATAPAASSPAEVAAATTTRPVRTDYGPDVVVLKELVKEYEPVPFDHRSHAEMAEMWNGCVTCHHHTPQPGAATRPSGGGDGTRGAVANGRAPAQLPAGATMAEAAAALNGKGQEMSAVHPPCRTCHEPAGKEVTIGMPNLQGAYHRQCLNCHREWMDDKKCETCHKRRDPNAPATAVADPSPDDIVRRMHPPIPEPRTITYVTRFTPAVGERVVFRHREHTGAYGMRCVDCHHRDNCASCHSATARPSATGGQDAEGNIVLYLGSRPDAAAATAAPGARHSPMKPGRTWRESHSPCLSCHQKQRCGHCHYKEDQPAPPPFDHAETGQLLDEDHASLACRKCHTTLRSRDQLTCGGAECHATDPTIGFPSHRPGPVGERPATRPGEGSPGPMRGIAR